MVKIVNSSYDDFMQDIRDKVLFLYGAGERAKVVYHYFSLQGKVKAIIDRNNKIKKIEGNNEEIPVISLKQFEKIGEIEKSVILITSTYVYMDIVEEMDTYRSLDGLRCYIVSLIQDYYEKQNFNFTNGAGRIPNKIHYCWFGGKDIPDQFKRYMESWHRFCPDYEIIRWDESNYDVNSNQYMREAYECERWGYVPDYARLDIIYREGGIYLDTDVELLAPIDQLLNDDMFCNFSSKFEINFGLGFGAIKGHELIKRMRDYYNGKSFYKKDGSINAVSCAEYQNPVLEECGFKLDNRYQKIKDAVLYPSEVANPKGRSGAVNNFTEKTLMIHHTASTHRTEDERKRYVYGMSALQRRIGIYK